ncbi:AbgT family transporter [Halomonas sp. MCCC 1A11036]|uniref:AbgT family transporter n=1 Tax=Billgrantia zhangzhouensis TaxID=2733481 RepID=A0ABS9AEQ6_9GAMM|nr:AbgT family transporter [Halomonas zhangzhouensis]MCE8020217.1 AbgT family transporter [Halomonas zhangzhouensis]
MPTLSQRSERLRRGAFTRFLDSVEWLGNLLPHPVTLFALLCVIVVVASGIAGALDVSVADPRPANEGERLAVNSLLNAEGLRRLVTEMVTNFTGFAPLGTVLVAMLGVGVAEHSGLLSASMRALVLDRSPRIVTYAVVFAGIMSNMAAELGYVVLIPLAAMIFHSLGRHPLAGLAAAFCGVSGGYSANLLIGTVDPLLSGITQEAARLLDPSYSVGAEANWFFMIASTFVVTLIGGLVTERIVEPKLGKFDATQAADDIDGQRMEGLSSEEKRALKGTGLATLAIVATLAAMVVPANGILRHPETGAISGSPFLSGIVVIVAVSFSVLGFIYGRLAGTMRGDRDIVDAMARSMSSLGLYIVLVFFAAQFVALFNWSNFGTVIAVAGADLLQTLGLRGPLLFALFILMCAFVNLSLGSASAQWAVTAPIFVPMLMLMGYAPEVIQAAYRIGDSVTNLITPMMSYFGLIMAVAARYRKDLGIGTLVALMLPYTLFMLVGWSLLFFVWVFLFGLPVGPGSATHYVL